MANIKRPALTGLKIALILAITMPILLALLALQGSPSVNDYPPLDTREIAAVEDLIIESAPRRVNSQSIQELTLQSGELNLLLRYAGHLGEDLLPLTGRISLPGNTLSTEIAIPLSNLPLQPYLNIRADFSSNLNELSLSSLSIGHLSIPPGLISFLGHRIENNYLNYSQSYVEVTELLQSVRNIEIANDQLHMEFHWEPALLERIRNQAQQFFISPQDQIRIAEYYRLLATLVAGIPESTRAISLSTLLQPLFQEAMKKSALRLNPIEENRALILTLAAYVNQEDIRSWLSPELSGQISPARLIEIRTYRRQDLAQHIISSAAIASSAGAGFAQVISNVKEDYDARYRSGFSFSDLTANTAGVAIGTLATRSPSSASMLQRRMAALNSDADFLPPVENSQDGLSATDFNAIYTDRNSEEYQKKVQEIEDIVLARPLFQGFEGLHSTSF